MILLIDNYDSFSYNLFQQAAAIEPDMRVVRNDALTVSEIEGLNPSHIILSPGPGYPKDAGICEEVVSRLGGSIPILGVCRWGVYHKRKNGEASRPGHRRESGSEA